MNFNEDGFHLSLIVFSFFFNVEIFKPIIYRHSLGTFLGQNGENRENFENFGYYWMRRSLFFRSFQQLKYFLEVSDDFDFLHFFVDSDRIIILKNSRKIKKQFYLFLLS